MWRLVWRRRMAWRVLLRRWRPRSISRRGCGRVPGLRVQVVFSSEEWARVEAAAGCLDVEGLFGLRGAGLVRALVMVGCGEVERRSPALFERASEEAGGGT